MTVLSLAGSASNTFHHGNPWSFPHNKNSDIPPKSKLLLSDSKLGFSFSQPLNSLDAVLSETLSSCADPCQPPPFLWASSLNVDICVDIAGFLCTYKHGHILIPSIPTVEADRQGFTTTPPTVGRLHTQDPPRGGDAKALSKMNYSSHHAPVRGLLHFASQQVLVDVQSIPNIHSWGKGIANKRKQKCFKLPAYLVVIILQTPPK